MFKRLVFFALSILFSLLIGCSNSLEKGFRVGGGHIDELFGAVKSQKTTFDLDAEEITMDFYYGHTAGYEANYADVEVLCYAVYFQWTHLNWDRFFVFDDYHNIEGHYFVKEISAEEFLSERYSVAMEGYFVKNKTFSHSESLTIPQELIWNKDTVSANGLGVIEFRIVEISINSNGDYLITNYSGNRERLRLEYEYTKGNTIKFK